jgi:hypothetical protein
MSGPQIIHISPRLLSLLLLLQIAQRSRYDALNHRKLSRLFKLVPIILIAILFEPLEVIVNRSKKNFPKLFHQVLLLKAFETSHIKFLKSSQ